ncbi:MAG: hypothetical protein KDJ16_07790, partial [Hyphomicrobiales bacterium]|nr:hypothetical protein [Hyphomicrobiales bacterium]
MVTRRKPAAASDAAAKAETVSGGGDQATLDNLAAENQRLADENAKLKSFEDKAVLRRFQEQSLKPYQAELIKLQKHLETQKRRCIIVF